MQRQFWVIGGEYTDTAFHTLVLGTERLVGPFDTWENAMRTWRNVAVETRSNCHARFTIVQEPGGHA